MTWPSLSLFTLLLTFFSSFSRCKHSDRCLYRTRSHYIIERLMWPHERILNRRLKILYLCPYRGAENITILTSTGQSHISTHNHTPSVSLSLLRWLSLSLLYSSFSPFYLSTPHSFLTVNPTLPHSVHSHCTACLSSLPHSLPIPLSIWRSTEKEKPMS